MSERFEDSLDSTMETLATTYDEMIRETDFDSLTGRDALVWVVPLIATIVNSQLEMITAISTDSATAKRLAKSLSLTTGLLDALQDALGKKNG